MLIEKPTQVSLCPPQIPPGLHGQKPVINHPSCGNALIHNN